MSRIRTIRIPVVITLVADAFGDHVVSTVMDQIGHDHPVFDEHNEQLVAHNTVAVAKRHVASIILAHRALTAAEGGQA